MFSLHVKRGHKARTITRTYVDILSAVFTVFEMCRVVRDFYHSIAAATPRGTSCRHVARPSLTTEFVFITRGYTGRRIDSKYCHVVKIASSYEGINVNQGARFLSWRRTSGVIVGKKTKNTRESNISQMQNNQRTNMPINN